MPCLMHRLAGPFNRTTVQKMAGMHFLVDRERLDLYILGLNIHSEQEI